MFSLRLLGATDLRDGEGNPVSALLSQPSRFALLAYLCVRRDGMVRRDELLAVFWPELDEARARNALSQALHFLRRALPEGAVVTRGVEVGIDSAKVRCDVTELERLVSAGDDASAVALYGGELLPAFNLNGVPGFERWLDAERSRLRTLAAHAARRACDSAQSRGDHALAIVHARRLVDIEHDERALRTLMSVLVAAGDRTAALAAYQAFSRQTRDSLEVELSAETLALVSRLGEPDPSIHSPPEAPNTLRVRTIAPPEASSSQAERKHTAPIHRQRTAAVLSGLILVVMLATAWLVVRARTARASASVVRVAVMPFRIFASPELSYLSGGMMDVLSLDMDGVGPVQAIDPHAVASFVAHADTTDQVALGIAAARALSADRFVLGTIVVTGTRSRVSATLYDARGKVMTTGVVDVEGTSNVLGATDEIARKILAHELPAPSQGMSRLAALTSSSTPALRRYLEGERHYRDGRFDLAVEAFGAAVREDSTFALGNYRLAASLDWGIHRWDGRSQYEYLERAMRHMQRLGTRDQQVIQGLHEFWSGSPRRSADLYRNVIADRPNDLEAQQGLAEVTFHRLIYWGASIETARVPFERVLALDPENVDAMVHLSRLAALRRDDRATDSLARKALSIAPAHDAAHELHILRALASSDTLVRAHALDSLRSVLVMDEGRWDPIWLAGWRVATFREDPVTGAAVALVLADARRPAASRLLGEILAAEMSAALGRWDDASRHLDVAARIDGVIASQIRTAITLMGPFTATHARLRQLRAIPSGNTLHPLPAVLRADPPNKAFARGLEAIALDDSAGIQRAARDLEAHSDSSGLPLARFHASVLRARTLQKAGKHADALAILESRWPNGGETSVIHYSRAWERILRGDLLRELGRHREALGWYESIPEDLGAGLIHAAPAHLGAARAHEALGDRSAAAREYARVAQLWKNADSELKPIAEDAARRAAALR